MSDALPVPFHAPEAPVPDTAPRDARQVRRGRVRALWILLVCAAPVLASYFTYYVVRPEGRRNFGELIEPQRPLPALTAHDPQGGAVDLQALKGQWLLVSVAGAQCDTACEGRLYLQRQLRESLGKDRARLDRVWLVSDDAPLPERLQGALQDATVLRVPGAALAQWLAPAAGQALQDHLYLVDPMGQWMMRFPAHMGLDDAHQARRDLERLMRASASWDTPGRNS